MKKRKTKKSRTIINFILVILIFGIITYLRIETNSEKNIKQANNYEVKNVVTSTNNIKENEKVYSKEEVIKEYKGYEVDSKLEIPKIELETYVLKEFSKEALNVSVTKFWGCKPNVTGNYCIAGHNFKNKNMFHDLKKLEKQDNLFIIDNKVGKVEYEIYDIYKVLPEDTSCLEQETNGKKEVTLITCTSDSEERIIVKATEKIRGVYNEKNKE